MAQTRLREARIERAGNAAVKGRAGDPSLETGVEPALWQVQTGPIGRGRRPGSRPLDSVFGRKVGRLTRCIEVGRRHYAGPAAAAGAQDEFVAALAYGRSGQGRQLGLLQCLRGGWDDPDRRRDEGRQIGTGLDFRHDRLGAGLRCDRRQPRLFAKLHVARVAPIPIVTPILAVTPEAGPVSVAVAAIVARISILAAPILRPLVARLCRSLLVAALAVDAEAILTVGPILSFRPILPLRSILTVCPVTEPLLNGGRHDRLRLEPLARRGEPVVDDRILVIIIIRFRIAGANEARLGLILCLLGCGDDPEVVLRMLEIAFRSNRVARCLGVARQLQVFLPDMLGRAPDLNIGSIGLVGSCQRIGAFAVSSADIVVVAAPHTLILTRSRRLSLKH